MVNLPVIEIKGVSKNYVSGFGGSRKIQALKTISLTIMPGEIFGVLGPNGAGKTTLMNILMGLITADQGQVKILGQEVTRRFSLEIKKRMNMCSGNPNFPWCLSVKETLNFYGLLYGLPSAQRHQRMNELIELLELKENRNTRYDELSTGNKQRLSLAKALMNDPEILLLDEPTMGLDPDISYKIRQRIQTIHVAQGKTILLTTHDMREAEELCERIAFIKAGQIIALGTKAELQALTQTQNMEEAFLELVHQ